MDKSSGKLLQCKQLTCITAESKKATLCFQYVSKEGNFSLLKGSAGKIYCVYITVGIQMLDYACMCAEWGKFYPKKVIQIGGVKSPST